MMSVHGLIVRLERADRPDRKLDAEIVAYVLGPPGAVLNPIQDVDGWEIDYAPDENGEAALWMSSSDVPGVTSFMDAAQEVVGLACPQDGAALLARALRNLMPFNDEAPGQFASRAARSMMTELLRAIASARSCSAATRAA